MALLSVFERPLYLKKNPESVCNISRKILKRKRWRNVESAGQHKRSFCLLYSTAHPVFCNYHLPVEKACTYPTVKDSEINPSDSSLSSSGLSFRSDI